MTRTAIYLLALLLSGSMVATAAKGKRAKAHKAKTYLISGSVQQTESYCGGARPPDEMLKQLRTPKPYPNKKFYVRRGSINTSSAPIIAHFVSDSLGMFTISLPADTYSIIVEEQVKPIKPTDYIKENQHADPKCLQAWWLKPYYLLVVKNQAVEHLNFVFHHRCFLSTDINCVQYSGPMPP